MLIEILKFYFNPEVFLFWIKMKLFKSLVG